MEVDVADLAKFMRECSDSEWEEYKHMEVLSIKLAKKIRDATWDAQEALTALENNNTRIALIHLQYVIKALTKK